MTPMLHHIQKSVINVLAGKDPARYTEIKPRELDGNQFSYHLKQLLGTKYIQKNIDGTYSLTKKGQSYLVRRYENLDESAHSIFLVVIKNHDKLLLRKRLVQPSLGYAGFIHGEPVASSSLEDVVIERVKTKTGITLDGITIHGSGLLRIKKGTEIESFSHAIIVSAYSNTDTLPIIRDATGENYWVPSNELDTVLNLLPSCHDIIRITNAVIPSYFDLTYNL